MNDGGRDERIKIDLDPEIALDALLKVDPGAMADQAPESERCAHTWNGQRCLLKAGHFEAHLYHP
jgi:hypothetical protein